MRADIQIVINESEKSLSLLRQRLDWDNVKKKREEFDALTEDPDLWNEPYKAQNLMRERQNFIDQLDGHDAINNELKENIELCCERACWSLRTPSQEEHGKQRHNHKTCDAVHDHW